MGHDDASSDSDSGEDYYLQNDGPKFGNDQNEQQNFTNADMYDSRIWNLSDCEQIISSHTNPVGKVKQLYSLLKNVFLFLCNHYPFLTLLVSSRNEYFSNPSRGTKLDALLNGNIDDCLWKNISPFECLSLVVENFVTFFESIILFFCVSCDMLMIDIDVIYSYHNFRKLQINQERNMAKERRKQKKKRFSLPKNEIENMQGGLVGGALFSKR